MDDRLVVVATFTEPNVAHVSRAKLECEGVHAALEGEHLVSMDWLVSNAIGGVKLLVPKNQADRARSLLRESSQEHTAENPAAPENHDGGGERCPLCHSDEVYRGPRWRRVALLSVLLIGLPLLYPSRRRACAACGHAWKPSDA